MKKINNFNLNVDNLEFLPQEELKHKQFQLLQKHIEFTVTNSSFYKKLFKEGDINIQDIKSFDDYKKIPFTTKEDINNHNKEFQAVSDTQIVDLCLTSATTGNNPTTFMLTKSDLDRLAYNEFMAFQTANLTKNDTILICASLEKCFMAGIAYFLGGSMLGAKMIRGGANNVNQLWTFIKQYSPTAIVGVPSLMDRIMEYAITQGDNPSKSSVKNLIAIGEPTKNADMSLTILAEKLQQSWKAGVFSTYASTELSTSFCECNEKCGGHERPELIVTEIVDKNEASVEDDKKGEVVVTPLGVSGMPLLRYKSGDISFIINDKCLCGRTSLRLGPIISRKKNMLKYKGTTVYPENIIKTIEGYKELDGVFVEVYSDKNGLDDIVLSIVVKGQNTNEIKIKIKKELQAKLRVTPSIKIVSKKYFNENVYKTGKRKRQVFFDKRG